MTPINFHKKEKPLTSLVSMGGGAAGMANAGTADETTYADDVFSTYVYTGNNATQTINNGIKFTDNNAGYGVTFDKYGDYLNTTSSSSDFTMGTGDFTIECWVYINDVSVLNGFFQISSTSGGFDTNYGNTLAVAWDPAAGEGWHIYGAGTYSKTTTNPPSSNTWYHTAYVRSSGTSKLYINGTALISLSDTTNYNGTYITIGGYYSTSYLMGGIISNFRVVKGTAVYTGNFTPPTEELTSVTNTKLLCCNNILREGSTVTPAIINVNGNPTGGFGPFTGTGGEGGMVWVKSRVNSYSHVLYDTVRGTGTSKSLVPDLTAVEGNYSTLTNLSSFNNNGFTLGTTSSTNILNDVNIDFTSWSFRKSKGFFDIVTYTGTGSNRTIPHSLGSVPGCIIIKGTSNVNSWYVYHRNVGAEKYLRLNDTDAETDQSWFMNDTEPTSSAFSVGTSSNVNGSGQTYVAYLWAGGASSAATARSVDFDGSGDVLTFASSDASSFSPGTGDFCVEAWLYPDSFSNQRGHFSTDSGGTEFYSNGSNYFFRKKGGSNILTGPGLDIGQWTHVAVTRSGTSLKMFYNGTVVASATDSTDFTGTSTTYIGASLDYWDGKISNIRFVKGSAVYTSSFRPPTEPLTNITNTTLLCCNNSSVTGSTVTPGTITAGGDVAASTDSPFDDPKGFKFGEEGDENIIKTGSYVGNGSSTGPEINVGWEPTWVMVKRADASGNDWLVWDTMRGIVTNGTQSDPMLYPNSASAESTNIYRMNLTSTGFKLTSGNQAVNANTSQYIYMCIRRPDGYVGKPAKAATDVFGMDYGSSSSAIPTVDIPFPVDFGIARKYAASDNWLAGSRLTGTSVVLPDSSAQAAGYSNQVWDSNIGFWKAIQSTYLGYAWKRGQGMDVVTYSGDGQPGFQVKHSMNKVPEMIWVKRRDGSNEGWSVYHTGLNGGTNPENWNLKLDDTSVEEDTESRWNDTPPTSLSFTLGNSGRVNSTDKYIAMLFASVNDADDNPISKVGFFAGSNSAQDIPLGFRPRFFLLKNANATEYWPTHDSLRGFDERLAINNANPQATTTNWVVPTASGVTLIGNQLAVNRSGYNYIYYAHA